MFGVSLVSVSIRGRFKPFGGTVMEDGNPLESMRNHTCDQCCCKDDIIDYVVSAFIAMCRIVVSVVRGRRRPARDGIVIGGLRRPAWWL